MEKYKYITLVLVAIATFGLTHTAQAETKTALFAGGCFWCLEHDLEKLDGVSDVVSGYAGGDVENPEYRQVSSGTTGHYEVVEVIYDNDVISYYALLNKFFRAVDPFDGGGQFCDRGQHYAPAVFTNDVDEQVKTQAFISQIQADTGKEVQVALLDSATFYPAEDYHQDYAEKNPIRYKYYRWNCGRDQRIEEVWSK